MTTAEAYVICRAIAKREAKNFYYAFRVLPQHKSDAMCAVYAFMRRADDIADDESLPLAQRRTAMDQWVKEWRAARDTGVSNDPVFIALNDTQRQFAIPDSLLEELVEGTTMDLDLQPPSDARPLTYATFNDLYRYCYLVASVVGLVCIRIFGYTDPRAEKLAEETGIAFQLTNILRDVKEDAERGRIYLPLDTLASHNATVNRIQALAAGEPFTPNDCKLLAEVGHQAESYYGSAKQLLPLIDADSRAALWVLVTIYHGLLRKIVSKNYNVFSGRTSVPTSRKLLILVQGVAISARNRVIS